MQHDNLYTQAFQCINASDADIKLQRTRDTARRWFGGELSRTEAELCPIDTPGRPEKPKLVAPRYLPKRSMQSAAGRAALIHSLCHIEFNAINLAWDAIYRFRDLPDAYYSDWIKVAREEAYHFSLLREHLRFLDHDYGDFGAHNGLWEMCIDTAHDALVRMALVPRVLEARGLDVTPGIINKLQQAGDVNAVDLLRIIQRDEVGHVEIGSRWFDYLCRQRGLSPFETFKDLFSQYMKGGIKGPLDRQSRLEAGFSQAELDYLEGVG